MALIEIRNLKKHYRMGTSVVRALDGVDLDIERGEFVAITGASGSGKSTMMHLLGCLDRPTSGSFVFNSRDVSRLNDRQLAEVRNRQIGFVFQTFNLINRTTALDNVAVPLFYSRQSETHAPARAALERVGLKERATHRSNELSGGERQRVAIARAIVNDPLLVLADEPTGNLDSRTGQQIMDLFRVLNEQGVTVVLVTHEYEVAIQTRRIVQMRDGKIVSDRPTDEIIREEGGPSGLQTRAPRPIGVPSMPPPQPVAAQPATVGTALMPEEMPVAAAAHPTTAAKSAEDYGPPQVGRGANASLILAFISIGVLLIPFVVGQILPPPPQQSSETLSKEAMILGVVLILAVLAAIVLGIIAIVTGTRARRFIRTTPGNWYGLKRALAAIIIGWIGAAGPILLTVLSMIAALASGKIGGVPPTTP